MWLFYNTYKCEDSKAIDKSELRSAIRMRPVYNAIIQKYNLNVNCPIVNTSAFTNIRSLYKRYSAQLPFPLTILINMVTVVGVLWVFLMLLLILLIIK